MAAADPAAATLVALMYDPTAPHAVRLAAARDLLDRAGLGAKAALEVTIAPWQEAITIGRIVAEVPDDFDPAADFEPDPDYAPAEIEDADIVVEPPAAPRTDSTVPAVLAARQGALLPPVHIRDRLR